MDKHNRLTPIRDLYRINKFGSKLWLFQCECGKQVEFPRYRVANNSIRSCGCSRSIDITSKIFGYLTAIRRLDKIKNEEHLWLFQCKCGNLKEATVSAVRSGHTRSCGCLLKREVGYSKIDDDGYVLEIVEKDKISKYLKEGGRSVANKSRYIPQHIKVMADFLGRPIDTKKESIHHKNGVRNDNRLKNLELRVKWHGPGHSVEDEVSHAIEVLKLYAPETFKN
jgi:HNH endonuclease